MNFRAYWIGKTERADMRGRNRFTQGKIKNSGQRERIREQLVGEEADCCVIIAADVEKKRDSSIKSETGWNKLLS